MKYNLTRRPSTPGEILSEEFLIPVGITQAELARHLDCDVKTVNRLVNNHTALNARMARRLAAALGTTPEFWINLQRNVDLYDAAQDDPELPPLLPQFGEARAGF